MKLLRSPSPRGSALHDNNHAPTRSSLLLLKVFQDFLWNLRDPLVLPRAFLLLVSLLASLPSSLLSTLFVLVALAVLRISFLAYRALFHLLPPLQAPLVSRVQLQQTFPSALPLTPGFPS